MSDYCNAILLVNATAFFNLPWYTLIEFWFHKSVGIDIALKIQLQLLRRRLLDSASE